MRITRAFPILTLAVAAACSGRARDVEGAATPASDVVDAGAGLGTWEVFQPRFTSAHARYAGVSFALANEAYVAIVHVAKDGSLTPLFPTEAGRVGSRPPGEQSVAIARVPVDRPKTPADHAASSAEYQRCVEQGRRNMPRPDRSATAPKDKDGRPIPIPSRPSGDVEQVERTCQRLLRPSGAEAAAARAAVDEGYLLLVATDRPISASELVIQISTAQITASDIPTLMLSLGAHIAGEAKWSGVYRQLR